MPSLHGTSRRLGASPHPDHRPPAFRRLSAAIATLLATAVLAPPVTADAPIIGKADSVLTGDTLVIAGTTYRLWGIDAPDPDQPCVNGAAQAYACGTTARILLGALTRDRLLTCRVKDRTSSGTALASCVLEGYDLAGLMVASGNAFDDPATSGGAYARQEQEARAERLGMWSGPFVKPADWRRNRLGMR